jgi:hypothetical protein
LDGCTGWDEGVDVLRKLTQLTGLEVCAPGGLPTCLPACLLVAPPARHGRAAAGWGPAARRRDLPTHSPHTHARRSPARARPQLSNAATGELAPWEALRELRGLQQLALHDFREAAPLQRSSRPSTPRAPGYLARCMPRLRGLALTGRLHADLLDRTSVAYAVGGWPCCCCCCCCCCLGQGCCCTWWSC